MIIVYEQFGIAFNLGQGRWTSLRKVNAVEKQGETEQKAYCIAFDYGEPGHAIPYSSEQERDSHWERIIAMLRSQVGAGIQPAQQIPSSLLRPFESR